ncbi:MAG TPA: hypothetical protein VG916_06515 [Gemmatimonadaceae bacterium]|nr:hypothetical protein [Gemmatimonadaceae bacterium]
MKTIIRPVAVLAVALGALAGGTAPLASQQPSPDPKVLLETMRNNVDRIMPSLENMRWTENVKLWQARLDHPGALDRATRAAMQNSLDSITSIVEQIKAPDERGRWEANRDLWKFLIAESGAPSPATLANMKATYKAMRENVAKITAPGEEQRWKANCDLWKGALGVK